MKKLITILIILISFSAYSQSEKKETKSKVQKVIKEKELETLKLRSKRLIYNKNRTKLC